MSIQLRVAGTFAVLVVGVILLTAGLIVHERDAPPTFGRPQPMVDCRAPLVAVARDSGGWACAFLRPGAGGRAQTSMRPMFYYVGDTP